MGKDGRRDSKYKVNEDIRAAEVRLIDESGGILGVMSSRDALIKAQDMGLDLIEIAPNAKPPTCKLMDYGKWKYENKKKAVQAKKNQTVVSIKEIQVRPRTEQHDLDVKTKKGREFLLEGNKVKVNLRFRGRENAHEDQGTKVLTLISKILGDVSLVEVPAKREGRRMFIILAPDSAKIKEYKAANKHKKPVAPLKLSKEEIKTLKDAAEANVDADTEDTEDTVEA